jgi:hypothetical protein
MPREPKSKYPWPASAMTPAEMNLLYRARESSPELQPITRLLARAVRETFGHLATAPTGIMPENREVAA